MALGHGVKRHCARQFHGVENLAPDGGQIPGRGQVHQRMGAGFLGQTGLQLLRMATSVTIMEVPMLALTLTVAGWPIRVDDVFMGRIGRGPWKPSTCPDGSKSFGVGQRGDAGGQDVCADSVFQAYGHG